MSFHLTHIYDNKAQAEDMVRQLRITGRKQVRILKVDQFKVVDKRQPNAPTLAFTEGTPLYVVQHEDVPAEPQPAPKTVVTVPEP